MRVAVCGCLGRMGRCSVDVIERVADMEMAYGIDVAPYQGEMPFPIVESPHEMGRGVEMLLDVSSPACLFSVVACCMERDIPLVVGTTGLEASHHAYLEEASHTIPVFLSDNFSFGFALLMSFTKWASARYPMGDIEIVETHHRHKKDAPSGTALALMHAVGEVRKKGGTSDTPPHERGRVGVHSLRMGEVVGEHTVYLTTEEEQLVLRHGVFDRMVFARGAVRAMRFLKGKGKGLYGMQDLIGG